MTFCSSFQPSEEIDSLCVTFGNDEESQEKVKAIATPFTLRITLHEYFV
ncbi:hypothetical protein [Nostoc sp. PCC 7107]|nr:hypothetical protein [Nostoc sp. PCC 7107]